MNTPIAPAATASDELRRLAHDFWERQLEEHPVQATYLGDRRGADRIDRGDEAAREARDIMAAGFQQRLARLGPLAPGSEDDITRRILDLELRQGREAHGLRDWEWDVDQLFGLQLLFPNLMGVQPLDGPRALDDLCARLSEVPRAFREHVTDIREGIAKRRVPPRLAVTRTLGQVERIAGTPVESSPFVAVPLSRLPAGTSAADRASWTARLADATHRFVVPAYRAYGAFLSSEVLPVSRETPGIWSIPGGDASYDHRVSRMTTTDLTPEEIHRIGWEELEKNRAEMLEVARSVGHRGDLASFLRGLREDPRFRLATREQILERYRQICARMEAALPSVFGRLPRTGFEVRAIEEYREKDAPAAFYQRPSADGSRRGVFWANTCNPSSWPTYDFEPLCFHEAVPGHHLQIALAQELTGLPEFRRHSGFTAYVEGWAHYTERLADEMGMYSTPYDRIGMLSAQAWRAARLVVDTGLHRLRWTRAQAIEVMESVRCGPSADIENEVDRYIAWPGQALAYKVGSRTITELREKVRRRQGERFDLRAFHDAVLGRGALPLSVLTEILDRS